MRAITKHFMIAAAATSVASGLGTYVWREEHRPAVLEIYVFALKSGHSAFIRTPEDERILIDGGSGTEVLRELTGILPFYSRRIDAVFVTDASDKEVSGAVDIVERYLVGKIYVPVVTPESLGLASATGRSYQALLKAAKEKNIAVVAVRRGDKMPFGSVALEVLFPVPAASFQFSNASPPETILRVRWGNISAVFLNDASVKTQKYLAADHRNPPDRDSVSKTDMLVVSHSALPTNVSSELMEVLDPDYLIYSKTLPKETLAPLNSKKKPVAAKSKAAISKKSSTKKKAPADPLGAIPLEDRLNLKEKGTIKIVSDGKGLNIGAK